MVWVAIETLCILSHGHLKYGPPGMDHAHLRIGVALALVGREMGGDRRVTDGRLTDSYGPTKHRFYRPFVLIDRKKAGDDVPSGEPRDPSQEEADDEIKRGQELQPGLRIRGHGASRGVVCKREPPYQASRNFRVLESYQQARTTGTHGLPGHALGRQERLARCVL